MRWIWSKTQGSFKIEPCFGTPVFWFPCFLPTFCTLRECATIAWNRCFPCIPWLRRWFRNGIDMWLGVPERCMKFGCSYISLVASLSCITILPPTNILHNCSHHHFATNILVVPTLLSSPLMFRSWAPIAVTQAGRGRGRGLGGRKSVV